MTEKIEKQIQNVCQLLEKKMLWIDEFEIPLQLQVEDLEPLFDQWIDQENEVVSEIQHLLFEITNIPLSIQGIDELAKINFITFQGRVMTLLSDCKALDDVLHWMDTLKDKEYHCHEKNRRIIELKYNILKKQHHAKLEFFKQRQKTIYNDLNVFMKTNGTLFIKTVKNILKGNRFDFHH